MTLLILNHSASGGIKQASNLVRNKFVLFFNKTILELNKISKTTLLCLLELFLNLIFFSLKCLVCCLELFICRCYFRYYFCSLKFFFYFFFLRIVPLLDLTLNNLAMDLSTQIFLPLKNLLSALTLPEQALALREHSLLHKLEVLFNLHYKLNLF